MERYGYKKMTMEDIALEARIGKATIYSYFNSKEEVALSVVDSYQKRLQERWREILAEDAPPELRLRRMLVTQSLFFFDVAQRYRLSMDDTLATLKHMVLSRKEQYRAELAQILEIVIREGCERGSFVCADANATAHTVLTCASGLSPSNLSSRELGALEELEARTHRVVDLILNGLMATRREADSSVANGDAHV